MNGVSGIGPLTIWQGVDEWFILPAEGEQQWDRVTRALTHTHSWVWMQYWYSSTNRNSGEPDYRLIDLILLKHYKQSHQQSRAQSDTAHIGRKLDIN